MYFKYDALHDFALYQLLVETLFQMQYHLRLLSITDNIKYHILTFSTMQIFQFIYFK